MPNGKAPNQLEEIGGRRMAALLSAIAIEVPRKGELGVVDRMIAKTRQMRPILRQLVMSKDEVVLVGEEALQVWHAGWPRFWRAFGFVYDHESLVLPEYREKFDWSIVTPDVANWPASKLFHEVCGRMFPTWARYDDVELDKIISSKEPTGIHVVLVRGVVEADECHKSKSAEDIEKEGVQTLTLRQRIVLEGRYFFDTGGHLHYDPLFWFALCGRRACA
jgi:hypothetical protein